MKSHIPVLLCLLLSVSFVSAAPQAGISTAELHGSVKDPSGAVVPSATVTLTSRNTRQVTTAITNEAGVYRVLSLRPDVYDVKVESPGFQSELKALELTV